MELDVWLRHTAETMRVRAHVLRENDPTAEALRGWAKEIEIAAAEIEGHNKEVRSVCNEKKNCGYAGYERRCPECPVVYVLGWPERGD